jgi:hypothetical protein
LINQCFEQIVLLNFLICIQMVRLTFLKPFKNKLILKTKRSFANKLQRKVLCNKSLIKQELMKLPLIQP